MRLIQWPVDDLPRGVTKPTPPTYSLDQNDNNISRRYLETVEESPTHGEDHPPTEQQGHYSELVLRVARADGLAQQPDGARGGP